MIPLRSNASDYPSFLNAVLVGSSSVASRCSTAGVEQRCPCQDGGIGRHEQGLEATRLRVRRQHHLLCVHAGGGDGQRPPRRLLPVWGSGEGNEEKEWLKPPGSSTSFAVPIIRS